MRARERERKRFEDGRMDKSGERRKTMQEYKKKQQHRIQSHLKAFCRVLKECKLVLAMYVLHFVVAVVLGYSTYSKHTPSLQHIHTYKRTSI